MKDYPAGPELIDEPEPLCYLGTNDGDGFFIVARQIDTSHHSEYRQAHHAPEQLWKREE